MFPFVSFIFYERHSHFQRKELGLNIQNAKESLHHLNYWLGFFFLSLGNFARIDNTPKRKRLKLMTESM